MPICIECSYPVSHLYSTYSRADDRSLGKGVRLTQCPRCKRFADKYVEYDFVVVFIDLVLIKPQVYRHLLFNRLGRDDDKFDPSIVRVGILLLLFDVYLTWARIEKSPYIASTFVTYTPIVVQYVFFLSLNALSTFAHHLTVRLLASFLVPNFRGVSYTRNTGTGSNGDSTIQNNNGGSHEPSASSTPPSAPGVSSVLSSMNLQAQQQQQQQHSGTAWSSRPPSNGLQPEMSNHGIGSAGPEVGAGLGPGAELPPRSSLTPASVQTIHPLPPPSPASPTAVSTALLVSSFPKLFPILLVIWGPDGANSIPDSGSPETCSTDAAPTLRSSLHGAMQSDVCTDNGMSMWSYSPTSFPSQAWITNMISSLVRSMSAGYLGSIPNLLVSLLSLGAADTHLVLMNNIEALYILLGCGYLRAVTLAVAGQIAPWAVQKLVLGAVGFGW